MAVAVGLPVALVSFLLASVLGAQAAFTRPGGSVRVAPYRLSLAVTFDEDVSLLGTVRR